MTAEEEEERFFRLIIRRKRLDRSCFFFVFVTIKSGSR